MNITEIRLEALRLACGGVDGGTVSLVERAAAFAAFLTDGKPAETFMDSVAAEQHAHKDKQTHTAEPAEPIKPVEQPVPAAAAAKTATLEDCTKAFSAHVQRAGGRSAMTARKAVVDVVPHFQNFKALTPEEMATAVAAMEAA